MAISRKRLDFTDGTRIGDYMAPQDIIEEIPDGTGRTFLVVAKNERLSFGEAVRRGLMTKDGQVTEKGISNVLATNPNAERDLAAAASLERAGTVHTVSVPEHAMISKVAPPPAAEPVEDEKPKKKK